MQADLDVLIRSSSTGILPPRSPSPQSPARWAAVFFFGDSTPVCSAKFPRVGSNRVYRDCGRSRLGAACSLDTTDLRTRTPRVRGRRLCLDRRQYCSNSKRRNQVGNGRRSSEKLWNRIQRAQPWTSAENTACEAGAPESHNGQCRSEGIGEISVLGGDVGPGASCCA